MYMHVYNSMCLHCGRMGCVYMYIKVVLACIWRVCTYTCEGMHTCVRVLHMWVCTWMCVRVYACLYLVPCTFSPCMSSHGHYNQGAVLLHLQGYSIILPVAALTSPSSSISTAMDTRVLPSWMISFSLSVTSLSSFRLPELDTEPGGPPHHATWALTASYILLFISYFEIGSQ